jgi:hypothetical protein
VPHHFGNAPLFLDNPATKGNTVDTQNMAAVATASGRLQRGTGRVLRTTVSGILRCWPDPVIMAQRTFQKGRFKKTFQEVPCQYGDIVGSGQLSGIDDGFLLRISARRTQRFWADGRQPFFYKAKHQSTAPVLRLQQIVQRITQQRMRSGHQAVWKTESKVHDNAQSPSTD